MKSIMLKGAAFVFASLFATLVGFAAQGGTEQPKAAVNKGKEAFEGACGGCHPLDVATDVRYPRDQWAAVVQRMLERGADVKAEDVPALIDFLTATYGVKPAETPATK